MVRQVRLFEVYQDATGTINERSSAIFAFGTHPDVTSEDEAHAVTSARAERNVLRVIMDELLVGNELEEIKCRGVVNAEGQFSHVPLGATPDDIARCSVAVDVLPASCPGSNPRSVCICDIDGGCGETAKGAPVGVLDDNADGAADERQMIPGAVGLKCGSVDVPIDPLNSYWNPSGDQNVPALGGFDALGPAIVVFPAAPPGGASQFLPTNTTCNLVFASSVVDKSGNQVCAPPNGDVTKSCTPGDVSAFSFKVQPLAVKQTSPVHNGDIGVSRIKSIDLIFTAPLDPNTVATSITVTEGTTPYTLFTTPLPFPGTVRITWTNATGLAANTMYTITVSTAIKDFYGMPMPQPFTLSFTTGA